MNLTGKTSDFLKIGVASAGRGDLETLSDVLHLKPEWISRIGSHGRTMLWEAAYRGKADAIEFLAAKGADLDARGCHFTPHRLDMTPWCAARLAGHDRCADLLVRLGARLTLDAAAYLGDEILFHELYGKSKPATGRITQTNADDAPLLAFAIMGANMGIVEAVINAENDPRPDSRLLLALAGENLEMVECLLAAGVDPAEGPPIFDGPVAELYRSHGVTHDINAPMPVTGQPPLAYVCRGDRGGNEAEIRRLLARGADPNVTNAKGQTALHNATRAGFVLAIRILLAAGADPALQDESGSTARDIARKSKRKQRIEMISLLRPARKS